MLAIARNIICISIVISVHLSSCQLLSASKSAAVNVPFPFVPSVSVNTGSTSVNLNSGGPTSSGVLASPTLSSGPIVPQNHVQITSSSSPYQTNVSVGNGIIGLLTNFGLTALQNKLTRPVEFYENKRSILEVALIVLRAQALAQRQATPKYVAPIYTLTKTPPSTGFVLSHTLNIHKQI